MHYAQPRFWRHFNSLPPSTQEFAKICFGALKKQPGYPSLRFRKVGRYWSARVGRSIRAVAIKDGEDYYWFWIGDHDEYLRIINR